MNALLCMAALALGGQVGDTRYGAAAVPPAAASGAAEAAFAAEPTAADPASAGETSAAPTLDPSAATEYAGDGQAPDLAPPPAQPLEAPPIAVAPPAEAKPLSAARTAPAAAETAPPEGSVLTADGPRPTAVMATLLQEPKSGRLLGAPLTLEDALHDAANREVQTARAKAYWDLATNVGQYNLAVIEAEQLAALRDGITSPGAAWEVKLREYDTRVELAKQAAQAAQLQLQKLLGPAHQASLPLPADMPHCGRYNTEYEEIFSERPDAAAKQLDQLLPLRYQQLRDQGRAIVEAHDWLEKVDASRDPSTDGTGLLQAYDLLSLRRRAFLATARDYNHEIAAYIELAAPVRVAPDRLVAMMIRTSAGGAADPAQKSEIQQTGAVEPQSQAPGAAEERTAAAGATEAAADGRIMRQVRRPLQRLFGREKSIVVERLQSLRNN